MDREFRPVQMDPERQPPARCRPEAVLIFGDTEKGVPLCATNVRLLDHPPATSLSHPD